MKIANSHTAWCSFVLLVCPMVATAFSTGGGANFFASAALNSSVSATDIAMPQKIAVTGATGRTGALVVKELLDRGVDVVALVRDLSKAETSLPNDDDGSLTVIQCDLGSEKDIISTITSNDCDAAIWCATGFSDNPQQTLIEKIQGIFGVAITPKQSIDAVGIPALAKCFQADDKDSNNTTPKVIMLSSAGVTRPSWSEEKKAMFEGSADIPIVRLNPFNILNIKADSEERLRQSRVPYTIFRPTGLNDKWPAGARPIFSQGDVAVGRINRADVAKILVDCLSTPDATGKTFEAFSLQGYPPAPSVSTALSRLQKDSDGPLSDATLSCTYSAMQQLLPGETQDAAALAMGQTYEQLDEGETGRLGERGSENAESAAPKPSS